MRRREGEYAGEGRDGVVVLYTDAQLREMRGGYIPEMYLALRKIGQDAPQGEVPLPEMLSRSFREQVVATILRFYTKEQIERGEKILED